MTAAGVGSERADGFRHEALMYGGLDDLLDQATAFITDGITDGEPTFAVIDAAAIAALDARVGPHPAVSFADMAVVGANPARIIPVWQSFVDEHPGRRLRGIGQPVWADRTAEERVECERHESLMNLAFTGTAELWLICAYDVETLDDNAIRAAERTHPTIAGQGRRWASRSFEGTAAARKLFDAPLPKAPASALGRSFDAQTLSSIRLWLDERSIALGLPSDRTDDLVLAVGEVSANSIRYGGGRGALRIWADDDSVVCEVADRGSITDPLAGRRRPAVDQEHGFGLWLANQVCDLVQIRSSPEGSVIRLHVRLQDPQRSVPPASDR